MSHPEQLAFFSLCTQINQHLLQRSRVLEIGSFDVNGSVRSLFSEAAEYCGVDLVPGPGVDRVAFGHEVDDADGSWDMTLSAECFEHDPRWRETLANMVRLTRPGGLVIVSCASRGRVEHGTRRTAASDSPGTQFEGLDYYRNVSLADARALPLDRWFTEVETWYNPTACDLYLVGIRAGTGSLETAAIPTETDVQALSSLMPVHQRIVRWPLRGLAKVQPKEEDYQRWAVLYWQRLMRVMAMVKKGVVAIRRRRRTDSTT